MGGIYIMNQRTNDPVNQTIKKSVNYFLREFDVYCILLQNTY